MKRGKKNLPKITELSVRAILCYSPHPEWFLREAVSKRKPRGPPPRAV